MKHNKIKQKRFKKTNVYPFLTRMYKLFKTNPETFVLKKTRMCDGDYDPVDDIINIDYRKEFISTLIHEVLHYLHPSWCETKVMREEIRIMNALSLCQIKTVLKRFSRTL